MNAFTDAATSLPLIGEWVEVQGEYTIPGAPPPLARRMAGHRGTSHWECLIDWRGQVGVTHWRRIVDADATNDDTFESVDWPEFDPPPLEDLQCKSMGRGYAAEPASNEETDDDQEHTNPSHD